MAGWHRVPVAARVPSAGQAAAAQRLLVGDGSESPSLRARHRDGRRVLGSSTVTVTRALRVSGLALAGWQVGGACQCRPYCGRPGDWDRPAGAIPGRGPTVRPANMESSFLVTGACWAWLSNAQLNV